MTPAARSRPRWLARGALGIAATVLLTACGLSPGRSEATYTAHPDVVLGSGALHGHAWVLTASENVDEGLCMDVNSQDPRTDFTAGGCGFGPSSRQEIERGSLRDDTLNASTGDGAQLVWGPAPPGTARVVIHSFTLAASASEGSSVAIPGCRESRPAILTTRALHPLPSWAGRGSWFAVAAPDNGCGYMHATFYGPDGRVVAKRQF